MKNDIQHELLHIIKGKINRTDNIGNVLSEVLSISIDAAYRRNRGETPLTIQEVQKLCSYFDISFDNLASIKENNVLFEYSPLYNYDFSFDSYLDGLVHALRRLNSAEDPHITLTVDNIALFQLLNFPHLTRFRLFYWAKSHLQIGEYQNELFEEQKLTDHAYSVGYEILQRYVKIPTTECYDPEFLKGFMRQIQYYSSAHLFKDPEYPLQLMDEIKMMADHIKAQAELGKKFIYRQQAPASGNEFNLYLNDTVNADNTYFYKTKKEKGIYIVHNHLNFLHTTDPTYVEESKSIMDRQLSNSSLISAVNEKDRNAFFHRLDRTITQFRNKIEADLLD